MRKKSVLQCVLCATWVIFASSQAQADAIQVGAFLGVDGPGIAIDTAVTGNILEGRVLADGAMSTVLMSDLTVNPALPPLPAFFIISLTNDAGLEVESLDIMVGLVDSDTFDFVSDAVPTFSSLSLSGVPVVPATPNTGTLLTPGFDETTGYAISFQLLFPDQASIAAGSNLAIGLKANFVPEPSSVLSLLPITALVLSRRRSRHVQ